MHTQNWQKKHMDLMRHSKYFTNTNFECKFDGCISSLRRISQLSPLEQMKVQFCNKLLGGKSQIIHSLGSVVNCQEVYDRYSTVQYSTVQYSTVQYRRCMTGLARRGGSEQRRRGGGSLSMGDQSLRLVMIRMLMIEVSSLEFF